MRIAFIVGVALIGFLSVRDAKADTFVNGVRYEVDGSVQYVSASACETAPASAGACSQAQSAAACGQAQSARAERRQPVRKLFGFFFRGRAARAGGCG